MTDCKPVELGSTPRGASKEYLVYEVSYVGAWRSLVAHSVWDGGVVSSNLTAPT